MSTFINIKGSMIDLDIFGQIQPLKIEKGEDVTYKLHFYDKMLNHRLSYSYKDITELQSAVNAINKAVGIKITEDIEQWL